MSSTERLLLFTPVPRNINCTEPVVRSTFAESEPSVISTWDKEHRCKSIEAILEGTRFSNLSECDNVAAEYYRVVVEPLLDENLSFSENQSIERESINTTTRQADQPNWSVGGSSGFSFAKTEDGEASFSGFVRATLCLMQDAAIQRHDAQSLGSPIAVKSIKSPKSLTPTTASTLSVRLATSTVVRAEALKEPSRPVLRERPSIIQKLTARLRKGGPQLS